MILIWLYFRILQRLQHDINTHRPTINIVYLHKNTLHIHSVSYTDVFCTSILLIVSYANY